MNDTDSRLNTKEMKAKDNVAMYQCISRQRFFAGLCKQIFPPLVFSRIMTDKILSNRFLNNMAFA